MGRPVGWRYESARHALAARGISTGRRYLSRFETMRLLPGGDVVFSNKEGQKIRFVRRLQTDAEKIAAEGLVIPSPDDVAYVLDEMPKSLVPADVVVSTHEDNAYETAVRDLQIVDSVIASKKERLKWREEQLKEIQGDRGRAYTEKRKKLHEEMKDIREEIERLERIKTPEGFSKRVEYHKKQYGLGGQTSSLAGPLEGLTYIYPVNMRDVKESREHTKVKPEFQPSAEDEALAFRRLRHVMLHEQGHRVGGDRKSLTKKAGGSPVSLQMEYGEMFETKNAPTRYATDSESEDFAESFAISREGESATARIGQDEFVPRWTLDFKKDIEEATKNAAAYPDKTPLKELYLKELNETMTRVREAEAAKEAFKKRKEFMQNLVGWSSPTQRELAETKNSPKFAVAMAALEASRRGQEVPVQYMAKKVDLKRYAGTWKQESVKNVPWFQKGMTKVTATYKPRKDGKITVINKGYRDGKLKMAKGVARSVSKDNRHLKVSFAPFGLFEGDYKIASLNKDYTRAVVKGGGTTWVLRR